MTGLFSLVARGDCDCGELVDCGADRVSDRWRVDVLLPAAEGEVQGASTGNDCDRFGSPVAPGADYREPGVHATSVKLGSASLAGREVGLDDGKRSWPGLHFDACVGVCSKQVGHQLEDVVWGRGRAGLRFKGELQVAGVVEHTTLGVGSGAGRVERHDSDSFG